MSVVNPAKGMVWLYDLTGNQVLPVRELDELAIDDRFGDSETLTFRMRANDPRSAYLYADQLIRWDDRMFRNVEMIQERVGNVATVEVCCEALWYDLQKRVRVGNFPVLGKNPAAGLTVILNNTGWTSNIVNSDTALYSIEGNDSTNLELLRDWARVTGNELVFDTVNKTIDMVETAGTAQPYGFRYGRNIPKMLRRVQPPVATRVYAYGAGDLAIGGNNPTGEDYVENYDWYTDQGLTITQARANFTKDQVWVDQRYLLGLSLYKAAVRRLARIAVPIISYEADVTDLTQLTGVTEDDLVVGDTVPVYDETFGVDLTTRVVRYQQFPRRPQDNKFELNYLQPSLSDEETKLDQRDLDYGDISIILDVNTDDIREIDTALTEYNGVTITVAGVTTAVTGTTFVGTATGTGTAEFYMAVDGAEVGERIIVEFGDGDPIEVSYPSFVPDLEEGTFVITWRAVVTSGTGTIECPLEGCRSYALVKGAVGIGFASSPSSRFSDEILPVAEIDLEALTDAYTVTLHDDDDVEHITISFDDTITNPSAYEELTETWTAELPSASP